MKNTILLVLACLLPACSSITPIEGKKIKARVTAYSASEDKRWRNKISTSTTKRAQEGETAAVNPKDIPYFSKIIIPSLRGVLGLDGIFKAEDTGSALKTRKASGGKTPVIDIYLASRAKMNLFAKIVPEYLDVYIENCLTK